MERWTEWKNPGKFSKHTLTSPGSRHGAIYTVEIRDEKVLVSSIQVVPETT